VGGTIKAESRILVRAMDKEALELAAQALTSHCRDRQIDPALSKWIRGKCVEAASGSISRKFQRLQTPASYLWQIGPLLQSVLLL
jgi:hypothetical protein